MMNGPRSSRARLPVSNPIDSFWLSQPSDLARYKSHPSPPEYVDIAIIGSGLSGVSAAYHILRSHRHGSLKPRVAIFEARAACSGATGRNGGHTKIMSSSLKAVEERWGSEVAAAMARTASAQRQLMHEIVERENIDCDFFLTRSFDIFFDDTECANVRNWLAAQREDGSPLREATQDMQFLQGSDLERVTGVKDVKGAVSSPAASLWPYKFVTQLLARVLDMSGEFYAETQVVEVSATKPNLKGATNILRFGHDDSISTGACHVIFATNGYTSALLPEYSKAITPVRGTASHLEVSESRWPESKAPPFLSHTYNLRYNESTVDYLVPRPDGAIILGGANATYRHDRSKWWDNVDDAHLIEEARPHFDRRMQNVYHGWEDSGSHVGTLWTGIMGYTADGMPHVGAVPGKSGQWIVAGFNGGGMSMILSSTKALVSMVLGEVEDWKDLDLPATFEPREARLHPKHNLYA